MIESKGDLHELCTFIATYVALAERCAYSLNTVTGYDGDEWTCDDLVQECLYWCRIAQAMVDDDLVDADDIEEDLIDVVATLRQVRDLREKNPRAGADLLKMLHTLFVI